MYLGLNLNVTLKKGIVLALLVIGAGMAPTGLRAASSPPYSVGEIRANETEKEAQIRVLRDQEITQIRIALGRRLPKQRMADLYFRLAELYLEAYRMEFLLEGRAHEKRISSGRSDPFMDRSNSKL